MSKETLYKVVDAIINDNNEEAEVSFHTYLSGKMKAALGQEPVTPDDITDEDIPADSD